MLVPASSVPSRLVFLDWLRILAFAVLVVYHVGMYYVSWNWHVKSPFAGAGLEPWMLLSSPWRMDLLFLVSGAATSFMLARTGASTALLRQRARRLLLPLLFGMLVVVPPQSWLEVVQKLGYAGSYPEFMALYLGGFGGFCFAPGRCLVLPTWNHLWFLPYLFVYTALLWVVVRTGPALVDRLAARLAAWTAGAGLLLWPLLFLVSTRVLLRARFPDTRALVDDWFAHSQYFAMFLLGVLLARAPAVWVRFAQWRWPALGLALVAWALLVRAVGDAPMAGTAALVLRWSLVSVQQWCAIVAALGFAQLHLNHDSRLRRYLTEAVFPVYILHQTAIILLAQWLRPWQLGAATEAAMLVGATLLVCLAGFEAVRRVGWMRPWMGLEPRPGAAPARLVPGARLLP